MGKAEGVAQLIGLGFVLFLFGMVVGKEYAVYREDSELKASMTAVEMRREWMQIIGFPEDEIEEHCNVSHDLNKDEELESLKAAKEIKKLNKLLDGKLGRE